MGMKDANNNISEAITDELGLVKAMARYLAKVTRRMIYQVKMNLLGAAEKLKL